MGLFDSDSDDGDGIFAPATSATKTGPPAGLFADSDSDAGDDSDSGLFGAGGGVAEDSTAAVDASNERSLVPPTAPLPGGSTDPFALAAPALKPKPKQGGGLFDSDDGSESDDDGSDFKFPAAAVTGSATSPAELLGSDSVPQDDAPPLVPGPLVDPLAAQAEAPPPGLGGQPNGTSTQPSMPETTETQTAESSSTGGLDETTSFHGVSVFTRPTAKPVDAAPPTVGGAPRRLQMGDHVQTVARPRNIDFLRPGQVGIVVEVDDMDPQDIWFSVEDAEGETDEYCEADLVLAAASTSSSPAPSTAAAPAAPAASAAAPAAPATAVASAGSKPKSTSATPGLFASDSDDEASDVDERQQAVAPATKGGGGLFVSSSDNASSSEDDNVKTLQLEPGPEPEPEPEPPPPPLGSVSSGRAGHNDVLLATALYDCEAQVEGDLAFAAGDVVEVVSQTEPGQGWWSGRLQAGGRTGIFPSNYVEVKPHDGVAVTQAARDSQRSSDRKNNAAIFASEDGFGESADEAESGKTAAIRASCAHSQ
jgi:hypothetical protein